jgi:hypothetical protein
MCGNPPIPGRWPVLTLAVFHEAATLTTSDKRRPSNNLINGLLRIGQPPKSTNRRGNATP